MSDLTPQLKAPWGIILFTGLIFIGIPLALTKAPLFFFLTVGIGCLVWLYVRNELLAISPNNEDSNEHASTEDALSTIRGRYARGEINETEFEHKLDQLLETETLEQTRAYQERKPTTERS